MELCSHHHDEICYEGGKCPLCSAIDEHTTKVDELESTIKDLERDIDEYRSGQQDHEKELEKLQDEINRLYRGQADSER